jgi:PhzF family phenazine biosynthesis protein
MSGPRAVSPLALAPVPFPMTESQFQIVDVFSEQPFCGNPVPVIISAEGLHDQQMQQITRWMNLSETAFLLPPEDPAADYRVRIFTLDREMPFAGHPTLGSCHAWLASGATPQNDEKIVQECGVGLVTVRRSGNRLSFAAPELIHSGPVDDETLERVIQVLQIDPDVIVAAQWADNGPGWVVLLLESAKAVLAIDAARDHPSRVDIGIVGACADNAETAFELRAFASDHDGAIREDPVTGSLNASVAQWLFASGRASGSYIASQGTRLDRKGRIYVSQDDDGTVWVGGNTATLVEGRINSGN